MPLLKEELLASSSSKGISLLEGVLPSRFGVVRIVAVVEPGFQFGVRQHFIRFVDSSHLLLRFLLGNTFRLGLIRVMLLSQLAVGTLDSSLIGISTDSENLVVVL